MPEWQQTNSRQACLPKLGKKRLSEISYEDAALIINELFES
jgi:hypothetical protein